MSRFYHALGAAGRDIVAALEIQDIHMLAPTGRITMLAYEGRDTNSTTVVLANGS